MYSGCSSLEHNNYLSLTHISVTALALPPHMTITTAIHGYLIRWGRQYNSDIFFSIYNAWIFNYKDDRKDALRLRIVLGSIKLRVFYQSESCLPCHNNWIYKCCINGCTQKALEWYRSIRSTRRKDRFQANILSMDGKREIRYHCTEFDQMRVTHIRSMSASPTTAVAQSMQWPQG